MGTWQLTGLFVFVGIAVIIVLAGWLIVNHLRERKRLIEERVQAIRKLAAEKVAAERAAAERAAADSAALARAAAERLAAKRAAMEKVAMEKLAQEKAAVEQAIAEWAAAEHAEAERANLRKASTEQRDADAAEARLRAVEEAISEWIEDEREGHRTAAVTPGRPTAEKTSTRTAAIHQQVRSAIEVIDKETGELDFIKNRIEAGVDFLPIEFRLTVDEWKEGKTLRQSSFDDLKQKFRYKAYSIEDGYELLHLYNQWLAQQRQKVRVFIKLLGVDVDRHDSMLGAIEHLEQLEREKYLEMDVDVIYTLRDIRDVLDKLVRVETILRDLDGVCRKRSEQIIAPEWEAKGSL